MNYVHSGCGWPEPVLPNGSTSRPIQKLCNEDQHNAVGASRRTTQ